MIPAYIALYILSRELSMSIPAADALLFVSVFVFAVASFTDFLDGKIARSRGLVTDMGKFLDPIADKLLVSSALFIIAAYNLLLYPYISVIVLTIIIGREFIVSALRQIAVTKGVVIAADMSGKIKTTVQLFGILFLLPAEALDRLIFGRYNHYVFYWIGFSLMCVGALLGIYSCAQYIVKNRKVFHEVSGIKAQGTDKE